MSDILRRPMEFGIRGLPIFKDNVNSKYKKYQTDTFGEIEYNFNNMGWRGTDDFPNDPTKHNYEKFDLVVGCSLIEGIGVKEEDLCVTKLQEWNEIPTYNLGMNGTGPDYLLWILNICVKLHNLNNVHVLSCYQGRETRFYGDHFEIIQSNLPFDDSYKTDYVRRLCEFNDWNFIRINNEIVSSYPKGYDRLHPNEDFQNMIFEEFRNEKD